MAPSPPATAFGPGEGPTSSWPSILRRLGLFLLIVLLVGLGLALGVSWLGWTEGLADEPLLGGLLVSLPAVLLASWFLMERVERVPLPALGLLLRPHALAGIVRGAALGAALTGGAVLLLGMAGWVQWQPAAGAGAWAAAGRLTLLLAGAALVEELLLRGYPLQLLVARLGGPGAVAATAVAFALLHLANPGLRALGVVNLALAGALLGMAWWRTYNLWYATGLHLGWNWSLGVAAGLPVSGLELEGALARTEVTGPAVWTGGAFGPEGGLAVTLACLAGLVWVTRSRRISRSLAVRALGPPADRREGGTAARERGGAPVNEGREGA